MTRDKPQALQGRGSVAAALGAAVATDEGTPEGVRRSIGGSTLRTAD